MPEETGRYFGAKNDAERLVHSVRIHIGDTIRRDVDQEFYDEDLYMFLMDADRTISTYSSDTGLSFSNNSIAISGTVTKDLAIMLIVGATYYVIRRVALEGTRSAIQFRSLDTFFDNREKARSGIALLKTERDFFEGIIAERNRDALVGKRINSYVRTHFPATDQSNVDYDSGTWSDEQLI